MNDWSAVGEKGRKIAFDLTITPLQIKTESEIGSGGKILVDFDDEDDFTTPVWIKVVLTSTPTYTICYCEPNNLELDLPTITSDVDKIWTFKKDGSILKLLCNEHEVNSFDTSKSEITNCKEYWNKDLKYIRFDTEDTASFLFRGFRDGK